MSVAYGYRDARELAAVFQGRAQGYAYGRQGNPTSAALEAKVTKMEDGVASVSFATGMAAIGAAVLALLREGDHVVASRFLFGNTVSLFNTLAAHGTRITYVDATGVAEQLDGRRLEGVEAVGKNLLLRFEGGLVLRSHLRGERRVVARQGVLLLQGPRRTCHACRMGLPHGWPDAPGDLDRWLWRVGDEN